MTSNSLVPPMKKSRRLHDAITRDADKDIEEREDLDSDSDTQNKTPFTGDRDSLAYSGTEVHFGFSANKSYLFQSAAGA